MVVETFLDLRDLGPQHTLILTDSSGKPWEVTKGTKRSEVVLERWIVEFIPAEGKNPGADWDDSAKESQPTTIYKQVVILMRSLYTYSRLLPAWNLRRKLSRSKLTISPLKVGCRILNGSHLIPSKGRIGLSKQIKNMGEDELEFFTFNKVDTLLGSLTISVRYRHECNFSIGDMEAFLSNHFLSLDTSKQGPRRQSFSTGPFNPASLPSPLRSSLEGSSSMASRNNVYRNHAKHINSHSSSEFAADAMAHHAANAISSPTDFVARDRRLSSVSLRDSPMLSPLMTQPSMGTSGTPPTTNTPSSMQSPTSSTRPSVSFIQPFKTPSLSASPSDTYNIGPSVNTSSSRPQSFSRTTSNSSLAALRIPNRTLSNTSNISNSSANSYIRSLGSAGGIHDSAIASSPSSSRSSSAPKFSSSFGSRGSTWHQRSGSISSVSRSKRLSNAGELPSSLGSINSVTEPGTSFLLDDDDDGLGDFVQMVDSISAIKPTPGHNSVLLSGGSSSSSSSVLFGQSSRLLPATGSGTDSDVLSKFQHMKGSYSALSDSLLGSQHRIDRSDGSSGPSASPSHHTGAYPIPTSSPPLISKAVSQHTPSVPSRLSEEFTANDSFKAYYYSHPRKQGSRSSLKVDEEIFPQEEDEEGTSIPSSTKINPLNIPLPSSLSKHGRRESLSVSNRHTAGFKDMQEGIKTSHHQSLGASGHIFPGKELSSFRSNPSKISSENSALTSVAAHRTNNRSLSTSPLDPLTCQVRQANLNYQSGASGSGASGPKPVNDPLLEGPSPLSSSRRRNSRFSYYLQDDDEDREEEKPTSATDSLVPLDEDVFYFAMNDGDASPPPPPSSGYAAQGTSSNRYDALAWE